MKISPNFESSKSQSFASLRLFAKNAQDLKQLARVLVEKMPEEHEQLCFKDIAQRQSQITSSDIFVTLNKNSDFDVDVFVVDNATKKIIYRPSETKMTNYNHELLYRNVFTVLDSKYGFENSAFLPFKPLGNGRMKIFDTEVPVKSFGEVNVLTGIMPNLRRLPYADKFACFHEFKSRPDNFLIQKVLQDVDTKNSKKK